MDSINVNIEVLKEVLKKLVDKEKRLIDLKNKIKNSEFLYINDSKINEDLVEIEDVLNDSIKKLDELNMLFDKFVVNRYEDSYIDIKNMFNNELISGLKDLMGEANE